MSFCCGWRVAANILNKQSRTTDKGWSSSYDLFLSSLLFFFPSFPPPLTFLPFFFVYVYLSSVPFILSSFPPFLSSRWLPTAVTLVWTERQTSLSVRLHPTFTAAWLMHHGNWSQIMRRKQRGCVSHSEQGVMTKGRRLFGRKSGL
jgi:hypothetical protein